MWLARYLRPAKLVETVGKILCYEHRVPANMLLHYASYFLHLWCVVSTIALYGNCISLSVHFSKIVQLGGK